MPTETVSEHRTKSETEQTRSGAFFRPNVDIAERQDELVLRADMAGATGDSIDIQFEDGTLTIHARVPERTYGRSLLRQEYGVGDFYRTFRVSEQIDPGRIAAEYREGVLTLRLPKSEAAKPRKIQVAT